MFTGLIESVGEVVTLSDGWLSVKARWGDEDPVVLGESVAVNGCCLTVTGKDTGVSFDLLMETLNRTNLGALRPGARVNLERALRADGRFGGHFVQGHVDTTAEVLTAEPGGSDLNLVIAIPQGGSRYFIEKGSIAVNGVSLTVASLAEESFGLWIIPHTLQETNLGDLGPSDRVNLEYDLIAKYAERQLGAKR
jgi:riboflavin synthase